MLLVRTYIAPSKIEGVGVFAGEFIRKGTLIWILDPTFDRLISLEAIASAPAHLHDLFKRYAYPSITDPSTYIYETDNGRFMNHTEQPNTNFASLDKGWAIHDIGLGEEITCDYGEFCPDIDLLPPACDVAALGANLEAEAAAE